MQAATGKTVQLGITTLAVSLLALCQRDSEPDERAEGERGAPDDGHADHALALHLALDGRLQVLRLPVARLHLQQRAQVLERLRVLLQFGVADRQVVQVVALAALVTVLNKEEGNQACDIILRMLANN